VLKYAQLYGCEWNFYTCDGAAEGGHLDVLKWARRKGCEWNERTCMLSAQEGRLEVLEWARANGCEWDPDICFERAKKRGHAEVAAWIEPSTSGYDPGAGFRYMVAGESRVAKDAQEIAAAREQSVS